MLLIEIAAGLFIVSWVLGAFNKIGGWLLEGDNPPPRPPSPLWPPSAWHGHEKLALFGFAAVFLYLFAGAGLDAVLGALAKH